MAMDTWQGNANIPMSYNSWLYAYGNPINYVDPSGNITQDQANEADQISRELEVNGVNLAKDWGLPLVSINRSTPSPTINSGTTTGCGWMKGKWDIVELRTIRDAIYDLDNAMNGQIVKFVGFVNVRKSITSQCGINFRGCTEDFLSRDVVFKDGGTPPTSVDIRNTFSIDKWSVVHEFGHAWDRNNGWNLSLMLETYTGGYTTGGLWGNLKCVQDTSNTLPGCKDAGYYYGGIPHDVSNALFNRKEDFAESVAATVFPDFAQSQVQIYQNKKNLQYLFYPDYRKTPRWDFINGLINGTIGVK
jgi:hypothetical protein